VADATVFKTTILACSTIEFKRAEEFNLTPATLISEKCDSLSSKCAEEEKKKRIT
jgi:hypothetical protein